MATNVGGIEVLFKEANRDFSKRWYEFGPSKEVLPRGWRKADGRRALDDDLIFEKDVRITLRDGATIWADVFRPVLSDTQPVPAILAWSPYGKQGNGFQSLDRVPWRAGIPRDWTSDLEKFEALDPAEWCPRGYAIVNVDSRGVFDSDGDMYMLGTQDGRDGYDAVECIASQKWCNKAVGFAGNSYLAAAQWFIAAERPPHLKAIAPWEGIADYYRELLGRGGIPNHAFVDYRGSGYCGKNRQEDTGAMTRRYPLWNQYWDDKSAKFAQIDVPIYALASYSTMLHTEGTMRGFLFSSSKDKWLRIHHTQEWYDIYQKWANDDLQKFFDRYLCGKDNDWESTPKVRHSLLGFNRDCIVNRPEPVYPPTYVEHRTFFLDGKTGKMEEGGAPNESYTISYRSDSWDDDGVHFVHKFSTCTELIGYSQVKLYMSCAETNDLDVYVICRKLDANGQPLMQVNIPLEALPAGITAEDVPNLNIFKYLGPNGRLRASHRQVGADPNLSEEQTAMLAPAVAWHPHDSEDKTLPGQIVCLDIPLWPAGIIFEAGESIRLEIKGHEVTLPEFPALDRVPGNLNRGKHIVYTGPEYPSSIVLSLASGQATEQSTK
ncbi:Alpha/Beta hydrolase protein [Exophiala viscosa]|uniref:Alpha/Beta hydrolase protein n=1 Tax=Exophiala viscosa TaxID=2486360 RepID=A0AAN6ICM8_9EURO|nr:Alpha/Beta hydrolase protein [Exophiala viscosa]